MLTLCSAAARHIEHFPTSQLERVSQRIETQLQREPVICMKVQALADDPRHGAVRFGARRFGHFGGRAEVGSERLQGRHERAVARRIPTAGSA